MTFAAEESELNVPVMVGPASKASEPFSKVVKGVLDGR